MSISITSPQQIKQHPLNDSKAKYHWTFSKAQRFKKHKTNCPVTFYYIPNTKSKRSTSFGNGSRTSFMLTTDAPSSYLYNSTSDFTYNKQKNKGPAFAKNRQQCKQQSYIKTGPLNNPGPGFYTIQKSKTIQYSMRPKTSYPKEYFINNVQKNMTPGPGKYQQHQNIINARGQLTSKLRNPRRTIMNLTSNRFYTQKITPGPGHYDDKNVMKTGQYLLSTNLSAGKRVFSKDKRQLKMQINRQTPGPGSYRKPSDFGHYQRKAETIMSRKRSVTLQN